VLNLILSAQAFQFLVVRISDANLFV
jgi:hypothetical protein